MARIAVIEAKQVEKYELLLFHLALKAEQKQFKATELFERSQAQHATESVSWVVVPY